MNKKNRTIEKNEIMNFFREEAFRDELNFTDEDLNEIALHCISYSDYLSETLEQAIILFNTN